MLQELAARDSKTASSTHADRLRSMMAEGINQKDDPASGTVCVQADNALHAADKEPMRVSCADTLLDLSNSVRLRACM